MSKIQTARKFYDKHESDDCVVMMIAFAKLHVKAALKEALNNVHVNGNIPQDWVNRDSILSAYPLDNIK